MSDIDTLAKMAADMHGFDRFSVLVEATEVWLKLKNEVEIKATLQELVDKVIAIPLTSSDVEPCDLDYQHALDACIFAIPSLEVLGVDSETRLKQLGDWIDDCFPEGTSEAVFDIDNLMNQDEIYEKAVAFELSGNQAESKFKSWYQLLMVRAALTDAYYYHLGSE